MTPNRHSRAGGNPCLSIFPPPCRRAWLVSGAEGRRLSDRARHRLTNHCPPYDSPPTALTQCHSREGGNPCLSIFPSPPCRRDWLVSGAAGRRLSDRARHRLTNHCPSGDSPPERHARNGSSLRGQRGSSGGPPPPTPAKPALNVPTKHTPSSAFSLSAFQPFSLSAFQPFSPESVMVEINANCICTANSF